MPHDGVPRFAWLLVLQRLEGVAALSFVMGWTIESLPAWSKPCSDWVRSIWSFVSLPGGFEGGGAKVLPPGGGGGGSPV